MLTLRDVLSAPPRDNAEGYVIWLDERTAIKFKYEAYMALHRIVSNLTVKEVWRQLRDGTFQEFAVALPDEFHDWAKDTANDLGTGFNNIRESAGNAYSDLKRAGEATRKDQAIWIQRNVRPELRGLVFSMLDNKSLDASIWRMVEPKEKVMA